MFCKLVTFFVMFATVVAVAVAVSTAVSAAVNVGVMGLKKAHMDPMRMGKAMARMPGMMGHHGMHGMHEGKCQPEAPFEDVGGEGEHKE